MYQRFVPAPRRLSEYLSRSTALTRRCSSNDLSVGTPTPSILSRDCDRPTLSRNILRSSDFPSSARICSTQPFAPHDDGAVLSFLRLLLFSPILLLSRMRPILGTLLLPLVAIDQPVLYHGATCVHTLYRRAALWQYVSAVLPASIAIQISAGSCLGQDGCS